ncbi:thermonuclease family protein [Xanthobacter sp. KR7-65]|uniref:thermonuclease family protein n=1 Tax=Xanthobacter sp. KR7-65 TaxID=3156612 RepID=UPI0032B3A936
MSEDEATGHILGQGASDDGMSAAGPSGEGTARRRRVMPAVAAVLALVLVAPALTTAHAAPAGRGAGSPAPAVPAAGLCAVAPGSAGAQAAAWTDAGALVLADGRALIPEGIALPTRLEPDPARVAAAAEAARQVLVGCSVALAGGSSDRHGRLAGAVALVCPQAEGDRREDLARALLRAGAGLARAEGEAACMEARLAAEAEARAAGRGIWADPAVAAPAADAGALALRSGLFTLAEGRVLAAGGRDRIYLNFGSSWKQDFTVMIAKEDFATILGDSLDAAVLRGTRIQARGVVRADGGPAMMVRRRGEMARLDGAGWAPVRRRGQGTDAR